MAITQIGKNIEIFTLAVREMELLILLNLYQELLEVSRQT